MKPVHRLAWYLKEKKLKYTTLERNTQLVPGYLSKQIRSEASIGSDILERICNACPDLNPVWLLTGKGSWQAVSVAVTGVPGITEENILQQLDFIDTLAVTDREKYLLCRQYASKLAYQVLLMENKAPGKIKQ